METLDNNGLDKPQNPAGPSAADETWSKPEHVHIPESTYMPIIMALGMMCMLWGIVTTPWVSLVGAVLFVIAIKGWIGALRHEYRHSDSE